MYIALFLKKLNISLRLHKKFAQCGKYINMAANVADAQFGE